jgi:hypothetical protein
MFLCYVSMKVSRRPLTVETRVSARVSLFRICGEQSGTETGFAL